MFALQARDQANRTDFFLWHLGILLVGPRMLLLVEVTKTYGPCDNVYGSTCVVAKDDSIRAAPNGLKRLAVDSQQSVV